MNSRKRHCHLKPPLRILVVKLLEPMDSTLNTSQAADVA
jgi:hypothetical protein